MLNVNSITALANKNIVKADKQRKAEIEKNRYHYRGVSCVHATHSVDGVDTLGGSGVLEWCYSAEHALELIALMKRDTSRFHSLSVGVVGKKQTGIHPLINVSR